MSYDYLYKKSAINHAHAYIRPKLAPFIELELKKRKNTRLLELGCGSGTYSDYLAKRGAEVTGIDSSKSGIELAAKNFKGVRFLCESIYDIQKNELKEHFDVVLAVEVIEHLFFPKELIKAAAFCLKPGGLLLLTTPYHGYLKNLAISTLNKWDNHFSVDWDGGHVKFFSPKTLSAMVENGGFKDVRFEFAGRLPFFWKSMICVATKTVIDPSTVDSHTNQNDATAA